jgi:hypothetical protein
MNPPKNIRKPSGSNERDRRLRDGEYDQLPEALSKSDNPWVRPAFDLAIETSLRQGNAYRRGFFFGCMQDAFSTADRAVAFSSGKRVSARSTKARTLGLR